jgi:hypothetical protein
MPKFWPSILAVVFRKCSRLSAETPGEFTTGRFLVLTPTQHFMVVFSYTLALTLEADTTSLHDLIINHLKQITGKRIRTNAIFSLQIIRTCQCSGRNKMRYDHSGHCK